MTQQIHGVAPAGVASPLCRETARATVDLDAISRNVEVLREHAGSAAVMAVVKADGYGHGLVPSARAAAASRVALGMQYADFAASTWLAT